MGAIKHAFQEIGSGVKHLVQGAEEVVSGLGNTVAGALTGNPDELKKGLMGMKNGVEDNINALGEIGGGIAAAAIDATPLGAAINAIAPGAVNKFAEGAANSIASTFSSGVEGVYQVGDGIAHGNLGEIAKGALNVGTAAAMVIPGEGEVLMAAETAGRVGMGEAGALAGKTTVQGVEHAAEKVVVKETVGDVVRNNVVDGVENQVLSTAMGQPGTSGASSVANTSAGAGAPSQAAMEQALMAVYNQTQGSSKPFQMPKYKKDGDEDDV